MTTYASSIYGDHQQRHNIARHVTALFVPNARALNNEAVIHLLTLQYSIITNYYKPSGL